MTGKPYAKRPVRKPGRVFLLATQPPAMDEFASFRQDAGDPKKGFTVESRLVTGIAILDEWEICRTHGETPPGGFTLVDACRRASCVQQTTPDVGPEIQWRVTDPEGITIVDGSSRNKKARQ